MVEGPLSDPCILAALNIMFEELGWDSVTPDIFRRIPVETLAFAYLTVSCACEQRQSI
jgi:hypothetical protein